MEVEYPVKARIWGGAAFMILMSAWSVLPFVGTFKVPAPAAPAAQVVLSANEVAPQAEPVLHLERVTVVGRRAVQLEPVTVIWHRSAV